MVTKVAGGILGIGLIGTGSIAVAKPHWFGIDYMPEWHSLSKDSGYPGTDYEEGKFGKKYGKYLVGVTNESGKEDKNQKFWKWAYRRFSKDGETKVGKFSTVTEKGDTTSLNKICEEAYKKNTTDLKPNNENITGNDVFKKSDVWKYCSPGLLTHTDKDGDTYKDKIGGGADKTTLVSVNYSSNDWFWKIRNGDFWSDTGDWSSSSASGTQDSDKSEFKKAHDEGKTNNTKRKLIKDICEAVYKLDKDSQSNNNANDAKKFCALETPAS